MSKGNISQTHCAICRLNVVIAHLDAFCDRVRADEQGEARRQARAGTRNKTVAAIAGQDLRLAQQDMRDHGQASRYNSDIIQKENMLTRLLSGMLRMRLLR